MFKGLFSVVARSFHFYTDKLYIVSMVTYVVVRPELDRVIGGTTGGPDPRVPWTMTEILAQRYSSPDPVQKALLKNFHRYPRGKFIKT